MKDELGIKDYIRYMDDFIVLVDSKEEAIEVKNKVSNFLKENLNLKLNKKTNYFKAKQGVAFVGYHIYVNKIRLLNNNKKSIYKKVRKWNKLYDENELDLFKANQSLMSWMGHAKLGNNFEYIKKIRKKCKWLYIDENEENYLKDFML